jgi:tetratricopeptide (TPR) repeat protein
MMNTHTQPRLLNCHAGSAVARVLRSLVCLICLIAAWFTSGEAAAQNKQSAGPPLAVLNGVVRNSSGKPVTGAHVLLLAKETGISRETLTDASGGFSFSEVPHGAFNLTAKSGTLRSSPVEIAIPPSAHGSDGQPAIILVLNASAEQQSETATTDASHSIQFADKPDFAIAAVTDWTAAGGHGSDASLRASEALTRDAVKLRADLEQGHQPDSRKTNPTNQTENELREAVAKNPNDFGANHNLGDFYLLKGRSSDAVHYLQTAHNADPASFDNELELAEALRLSGDLGSARNHIQKLLEKRDTADLHRRTGELDESLGDSLAAAREFQTAVAKDASEQNYFAWGSELLIHRAIWQAKEVFDEGVKRYPASVRMLTARGATLFAGARYDDAAADLCRASDLEPEAVEPYLFMGKVEIAAPNPLPCVVEKLARFQKTQPANALANYYYAMALKKQQRSETDPQAKTLIKELLAKAVTLDQKCAAGYLELGNLSAGSRQWEAAINYYREAIAADKDLSDAHYRLGVAYQRTGQQELAKEQFHMHDEIAAKQAAEIQRQREAVKQFLVVLPDQNDQPQAH